MYSILKAIIEASKEGKNASNEGREKRSIMLQNRHQSGLKMVIEVQRLGVKPVSRDKKKPHIDCGHLEDN